MDFKVGDKVMQVPVIPKESMHRNTWHKSLAGMVGTVVFPLNSREWLPECIGVKFEKILKDDIGRVITHTLDVKLPQPVGRNYYEKDLIPVPEKFESISYERLYE